MSVLRNITFIKAGGISQFTALMLRKPSVSTRLSGRKAGSKVNFWEAKC
jgi:hypothetical protein